MENSLQNNIKSFARSIGADLVGFCELPEKERPLPNLPYAISIGVKLSDAVLSSIDGAPSFMYFQHYRTETHCSIISLFAYRGKLKRQVLPRFPLPPAKALANKTPIADLFHIRR